MGHGRSDHGRLETSIALSTAFLAAAGSAVLVIARRRRELRVPLVATFVVAATAVGTVRIVGGELQLVDLATDPGPDLRIYLTRERYDGGGVGTHVDLGALKGNQGTQRYDLPEGTFASVVIWCRAFSVAFGAADLDG